MKYLITLSLAFLCMTHSAFGQQNDDQTYRGITSLDRDIYRAFKKQDFSYLLAYIPSERDIPLLKQYENGNENDKYNNIEQERNNLLRVDDISALNFRILLIKDSFTETVKALEEANINLEALRANTNDNYSDSDHWKIAKSYIDRKTGNMIHKMKFSFFKRIKGGTYWTAIKYNVMATPSGYMLIYDFNNSFEILYYDIKYENIPKD